MPARSFSDYLAIPPCVSGWPIAVVLFLIGTSVSLYYYIKVTSASLMPA